MHADRLFVVDLSNANYVVLKLVINNAFNTSERDNMQT